MTSYHIMSTIILLIIGVGLWKRHVLKVHIPAMILAFILDVSLVLAIELNRQAIETVASSLQAPTDHNLLLFHVSVSLITVVMYVILTITGTKVWKGQRGLLKLHRNLAAIFLFCRLANYVTSFMVVSTP